MAFSGLFITVRSCNAADAPASKESLLEKANKDVLAELEARDKATTLSEKIVLSRRIRNLQEVIALLQADETTTSILDLREAETKALAASYDAVAEEFVDLVPVYAGNEFENPTGFGKALMAGQRLVEKEREEIRAVKGAVIDRLQEAHTRAVLDQDVLHVPEYTALLNAAPRNAQVLETIQQERLADEARIEKLANPSFWQTVKWWWNS